MATDQQLGWPTILSIVYFSLYAILLLGLSIHSYLSTENLDKKSFIRILWKKRSIYGAVLVHLYDTATDIGVIIEWWILAHDDIDYKTINLHIFVWCSISFLILYRFFITILSILGFNAEQKCLSITFHIFLGIIDMYIIKTVIKAFQTEQTEPNRRQKLIQLMESVFESLPQVILQSVFIIRSANDPILQKNSSIILVSFSLVASLFSITNKYIWLDRSGVVAKARDPHFKLKCYCYCLSKTNPDDMITGYPMCNRHNTELEFTTTNGYCDTCIGIQYTNKYYKCTQLNCKGGVCNDCYAIHTYSYNKNECIHLYYVLRVLWRFSFICIKFIVLSLIWVVLGGAFLGIFLGFTFIYWYIIYVFVARDQGYELEDALLGAISGSVVALIANIATSKYYVAISHWIEMMISLVLITLFSLNKNIRCVVCADPYYRQMSNNEYVRLFIVSGWVLLVIDIICFMVLLKRKIFIKRADASAVKGFEYALEDEK
eukprot:151134_1